MNPRNKLWGSVPELGADAQQGLSKVAEISAN